MLLYNILWSINQTNELVTTHGFSQNQIIVWNYPNMNEIASLTGHSFRVLYLSIIPDGQQIVTGAGDESIRSTNFFFIINNFK
jgi:cell division cycle 20-like protein 1, cofactor of APC complex